MSTIKNVSLINALKNAEKGANLMRLTDVYVDYYDVDKDARNARKKAFDAYKDAVAVLAAKRAEKGFSPDVSKTRTAQEEAARSAFFDALRTVCGFVGLKSSAPLASYLFAFTASATERKDGNHLVTANAMRKAFEHAARMLLNGETLPGYASVVAEEAARKAAKEAAKAERARRMKEADEKKVETEGRTNEAANAKETIEAANKAGKAEQPAA